MAIEKKAKKKDKGEKAAAPEKKVKEKKEKKAKGERAPREGSRKAFILSQIESAGKSGIAVGALIKAADKKFEYTGDKSSRLRVNNTIREAKENKMVTITEGEDDNTVTWAK